MVISWGGGRGIDLVVAKNHTIFKGPRSRDQWGISC